MTVVRNAIRGHIATIRTINTRLSSNPLAALSFSVVPVLIGNILFDLDGTLLKGVCFFNQPLKLFEAAETF